jgi:hypothetical protein
MVMDNYITLNRSTREACDMILFPAKTMPGQIEDLHDDQEMMGIIIIHEPLFYLSGCYSAPPPNFRAKILNPPLGRPTGRLSCFMPGAVAVQSGYQSRDFVRRLIGFIRLDGSPVHHWVDDRDVDQDVPRFYQILWIVQSSAPSG